MSSHSFTHPLWQSWLSIFGEWNFCSQICSSTFPKKDFGPNICNLLRLDNFLPFGEWEQWTHPLMANTFRDILRAIQNMEKEIFELMDCSNRAHPTNNQPFWSFTVVIIMVSVREWKNGPKYSKKKGCEKCFVNREQQLQRGRSAEELFERTRQRRIQLE